MSTFVHNEPTSLAIIQEVGLPEVFYRAIELGIEPAIEVCFFLFTFFSSFIFDCQVLQAIPNAIGALCLNEAGQTQLTKRPSIIPSIFSIFTSERHLKTLIDKENAVIIGTAVDELIRHHPSLKVQVFDALKSTLSRIEDLGASYSPPADIKHWYQLVPISTLPSDDDVTMQDDAAMESPGPAEVPQVAVEDIDDDSEDDDQNGKSHDNIVVSYIDIVGRVSPQRS